MAFIPHLAIEFFTASATCSVFSDTIFYFFLERAEHAHVTDIMRSRIIRICNTYQQIMFNTAIFMNAQVTFRITFLTFNRYRSRIYRILFVKKPFLHDFFSLSQKNKSQISNYLDTQPQMTRSASLLIRSTLFLI